MITTYNFFLPLFWCNFTTDWNLIARGIRTILCLVLGVPFSLVAYSRNLIQLRKYIHLLLDWVMFRVQKLVSFTQSPPPFDLLSYTAFTKCHRNANEAIATIDTICFSFLFFFCGLTCIATDHISYTFRMHLYIHISLFWWITAFLHVHKKQSGFPWKFSSPRPTKNPAL